MEIYKIKGSVPAADYYKIIDFLVSCWNRNHALVKSKALLDFQHLSKETNSYNFIVAENQITGKIDALSGYIPTSQYDPILSDQGDYWGAIWKRRDNIDTPEGKQLGLETFEKVFSLPNFKSLCGISLSDDAVRWYKALRWKMDYLHQYYIINDNCNSFNIADNVTERYVTDASVNKERGWLLKWISIDSISDDEIVSVYRPLKSLVFIRNRYQRHPIYQYKFLGLFYYGKLKAILVTRENNVNGGKVLRIVDAYGKLGGYIYPSIQEILKKEDFEYVDFLNYGINSSVFTEMGFLEHNFEDDDIILPNYFEPFERRNVKMVVVYKAKYDYVAFKGDADQDRPNII